MQFIQAKKHDHPSFHSSKQMLMDMTAFQHCNPYKCYELYGHTHFIFTINNKVIHNSKVKESHNRTRVAQRVTGVLGSQIFMKFGTCRWRGRQPHAPAYFPPQECSWYSFSLETESTPGPWCSRKEIRHWKMRWHHRESIPGPSDY